MLVSLTLSAEAAPTHSHTFHPLSPPKFLSDSFTFINKILNIHNPGGTKHWGVFLSPTKPCWGQLASQPCLVMSQEYSDLLRFTSSVSQNNSEFLHAQWSSQSNFSTRLSQTNLMVKSLVQILNHIPSGRKEN